MNKKKTIAFLDVLGFKEKILNNPIESIVEEYEYFINRVYHSNKSFGFPNEFSLFGNDISTWCDIKIFSDSIIIFSKSDSEIDTIKTLVLSWRLMQSALAMGIHLRGAIVHDEIYHNYENSIFLGKALVNASILEACQDWIGIAISDEIFETYPNIISPERWYLATIFTKYLIPFKDGSKKEYFVVNWRCNFIVEKGTRSLMPISTDSKVQIKVKNTLDFASNVISSGHVYFNDNSKVPIEIRSFWVGANKPPFNHGDEL